MCVSGLQEKTERVDKQKTGSVVAGKEKIPKESEKIDRQEKEGVKTDRQHKE